MPISNPAIDERDRAILSETAAHHRFDQVRRLANTVMFDIQDEIAKLPGATSARMPPAWRS